MRLKRPLNQDAVRAANAELAVQYPEAAHRQLDANDPQDAPYRQSWRESYLRNGGEVETESPDAEQGEVANDVHACPGSPSNIPIILLPGMMGSRLFFPDCQKVWDPDDDWGMGIDWVPPRAERVRRQLHYEAPAQVMTSKELAVRIIDERWGIVQFIREVPAPAAGWRGWESVSTTYYRKLLTELDGHTTYAPPSIACPTYAIGYDFRQSNADSGEVVATRVREILLNESAEEFILVTHSMGGLVARSMLQSNADLAAKAKSVLHIMQPAWGAPYFYYALNRGPEGPLRLLFGKSGSSFMTVASGQRGAAELLPNNAYVAHGTDGYLRAIGWLWHATTQDGDTEQGMNGDVYDMYLLDKREEPGLMWLAGVVDKARGPNQVSIAAEMRKRIGEAREFHEGLRTFSAQEITWTIYGEGMQTCVGAEFTFDRRPYDYLGESRLKYRPGMVQLVSDQGDDTVPVVSARGEGLAIPEQRKRVNNVSHNKGCTNPNVIRVVKDILRQVLSR